MAETHYIADILILLTAGIVAVLLFRRLGLGTVLGLLAAAALVGPSGLGFIVAVDEIRHLAEFGVVFLLGRVLLRPVRQLAAGSRRNPEIFTHSW